MGGGIGEAFLGGIGFPGRGAHRGPFGGFGCQGTFNAGTGRIECATQTLRNGLTVVRSIAFADAAGAVQQAFDTATTNSINVRSQVSGTVSLTPDSVRQQRGGHRPHRHGPGRGHDGRCLFGQLFGDTATTATPRPAS
jgi:hypothetical protein